MTGGLPELTEPAPPLGPTTPRERIAYIDVLRGFALFGILAANMRGFNAPAQVYFNNQLWWTGTADTIAQALVDTFISGKFITLFSFLFGLGFAVQMDRAEARGARFAPLYVRRLLVLLLIGAAHALLLWWGDILVQYALTGFLLLLFRRRTQKTVLIWAMIGYWFPVVFLAGFTAASWLGISIPTPPQPTREVLQQAFQTYAQGSYGAIFALRLKELAMLYIGFPFFFPRVLGIFLLGLYVWRCGFVQNLPEHLPLLGRLMRWCLVLGIAGNAGAVLIILIYKPRPFAPTAAGLVAWILFSAAVPALSAGYASAVALLLQSEAWKQRMLAFAAVGRTALSNYLLQSVVCTTLYYSYGVGLYGKVGPALGLLPTFLIYSAQIPLSAWWLRRFRFGPAEWLWRSLTYRRRQPMRRAEPAPAETV